jgi:O-antigen ligase
MWAALIMPALVVALAATLSRNAWVGACAGVGLLFVIRDFRLVALMPVAAAIFIAIAPAQVSDRFYSTFQLTDRWQQSHTTQSSVQSNRDRLAMIKAGVRILEKNPLTGVGPDMVASVYPQYRDATATSQSAAHLHNVPVQIAAERGLPALALWLWFISMLIRDFLRGRKRAAVPSLSMGALACVVAMLTAGLFEYNFGDSEFLMLFLLLVTLPYAADRSQAAPSQPA